MSQQLYICVSFDLFFETHGVEENTFVRHFIILGPVGVGTSATLC